MGKAGPLRWRDGRGWLVLVGGGKPEDITHILRAAIEAMSDESPVVFVPTASAAPDGDHATSQRIIAQIEALGGPVGYVAPIFTHADATDLRNVRRLAQAGLVYLGDGQAQRLVTALSDTPTLDALAAAYRGGRGCRRRRRGGVRVGRMGPVRTRDCRLGLAAGRAHLPALLQKPRPCARPSRLIPNVWAWAFRKTRRWHWGQRTRCRR